MKHAARVMVPARAGSIISMASDASKIAGVASHAYTCSKHAVNGLTKNLAVELGQFSIRVNCLSAYAMATPMATSFMGVDAESIEKMANLNANLKGVTLKTDDVAKAALFLASDEAKQKHAAKVMVLARAGSIISVASDASNIAGVATDAYTCSKHAVTSLTKNLDVELEQFSIRVNCLSPYAIACTPMATSFMGVDEESIEN
ncbi:hypothetical protein E3N88_14624 [Mikania micrantha]|uniref:Uncharacterized protein n=1 Tax=Mikania micrantha TaxID=192012 RepID=A0A5N6P1Y7_9ASTR|nr:hypothetical protein E3N88_14624 [Mikania micrantha]